MTSTNPVVANALATRRVARNALTVEQQREVRSAIPQIKRIYEDLKKETAPLIAKSKQAISDYNKAIEAINKVKEENRRFRDKCSVAVRGKFPRHFWEDDEFGKIAYDIYDCASLITRSVGGGLSTPSII